MNRRQRKKHRLGEFRELGFHLQFRTPAEWSAVERDAFLDAALAEVERLGLEIGGGAGEIWDVYVGGAGRRATVTSSQRAALLGWLAATDGVSDMQAGPLMDVWYDGVPASPAAA